MREMCDLKDELCQLCGAGALLFPAQPIYCSLCTRRIKENSFYYIPEEKLSDAQHQICNPCYNRCRSQFMLSGLSVSKAKMLKKNNSDNQNTEEVNFISLSHSLSLHITSSLTNYINDFCWSSGCLADLAGNGNIRYVVSTIYIKTLTKTQTTFVPTVC